MELERLVNVERISRGLAPLKHNQNLTNSARAHNQDMIENDYFSHTGSDGSGPPQRACAQGYMPYGWGDCYVGENINAGNATPILVFQAWLESQGHLDNLLDEKYREFGIGHTTGGRYGHYWTLDLGAQPNVLPIFINNDDQETNNLPVTITLTTEGVSTFGSLGPFIWIRASENPLFPNVPWQPWSSYIPLTLSPGNGVKTVYMEFTDGFYRAISSDSILLNMPPTLMAAPQSMFFLVQVNTVHIFPKSATIYVNNQAGEGIEWQAAVGKTWVSIDNAAGYTPSTLNVSLDLSMIDTTSTGVHQTSITLTAASPAVGNSPMEILVSASVVDEITFFYLPLIHR